MNLLQVVRVCVLTYTHIIAYLSVCIVHAYVCDWEAEEGPPFSGAQSGASPKMRATYIFNIIHSPTTNGRAQKHLKLVLAINLIAFDLLDFLLPIYLRVPHGIDTF